METGLVIVVTNQSVIHPVFSAGEKNSITLALEFMSDFGAAMPRDDYETRHKRQAQGIAKGKYRGRSVNESLHQDI